MFRAAKIFSWIVFLLCFTFIGLVSTNPIIQKEADGDRTAEVTTALEHSNIYATINRPAVDAAIQPGTAPKPAVMFLMGIGLIGLVAVGRSKLFG